MHKVAFVIIAASSFAANADIVRVDEFDSLQFEGFNNLDMGTFERNPVSVFGGMAEVMNTNNSWLHTTGGWSFKNQVRAYEGSRLLGNSSGGIEYQFGAAQKSFGGFFATIADTPDGKIKFYNGQELVGSDIVNASVGDGWAWNGWTSEYEFDRVVVDSNYGSRGGFLLQDAMRVMTTQVPTPGSLAIIGTGLLVAGRRRRA